MRRKSVSLLVGETWFPQVSDSSSNRKIVRVLSNRIFYRGRNGDCVCSPESFKRWIRKCDSKI